ncbi:MAG: hypothetical protein ACO1OB_02590 [Archangium sp.]
MKRLGVLVAALLVSCGGGEAGMDGGEMSDSGVTSPRDAGSVDAGSVDAGSVDAGDADAGDVDAGMTDEDAGIDAGQSVVDAGPSCAVGNGGCDALTTCTVSSGVIVCGACPGGYSGTGELGCVDVDECAADAGCGPLNVCANLPGSFSCAACVSGYRGDGDGGCVDVDECASDAGVCDWHTTCTNTVGDFTCSACPSHTTGSGRAGCVPKPATFTFSTWPAARSQSLCSRISAFLPVMYDRLNVQDVNIESGTTRYTLDVKSPDGGAFVSGVTDIASAIIEVRTNSNFSARALVFDVQTMLHTSYLRMTTPGEVVMTIRYCPFTLGTPCAEVRDHVVYVPASEDAYETLACDPVPVLDPASDLGPANDDGWTSDFTPTFSVTSSASTVTWYRDDVMMMTTPVMNGVAVWTDDGTATTGEHRYSVRHGPTRQPSAALHVVLSNAPPPAPYY